MSHDTVGSATYDPDADALYVRLSAGPRVGPSIEVGDDYVVDVDVAGEPVGVEMLNVAATARRVAARRRARERP